MSMIPRIRIIDTLSLGSSHEMFNSAMVYMCTLIAGRTEFRCSRSTRQHIETFLRRHEPGFEFDKVTFRPLRVYQRVITGGLHGLLGMLISGWSNVWQLLVVPRSAQLVYLNNNPLSLWLVATLNLLLRKKVAIFCHGEMERLLSKPRRWYSTLYKYPLKWFLRNGAIGRHTRMFVLGESILRNLQPYLNRGNRRQFFAVEHPCFFSYSPHSGMIALPRPLRLGMVGGLTPIRYGVLDLARSLRLCGTETRITLIGPVFRPLPWEEYPNVHFMSRSSAMIPREEFERAVEEQDYLLYFYPSNTYKLIASGALFDAMEKRKPIIALQNDYFCHVMDGYPIGYMVSDVDEMAALIERLARGGAERDEEYRTFLSNIDRLKERFTPETVAADFASKLE